LPPGRQTLTRRDAVALEKIWADDYTFINGKGDVLTKAQRLENLKSGSTALDSINEEEEIKVRVYGGDTAVAISRVTIRGQYSGKQWNGQFRSSHTWARTPSGWQLVCNQITPVTSP
jgi:ketosteroid isomerase-like protein